MYQSPGIYDDSTMTTICVLSNNCIGPQYQACRETAMASLDPPTANRAYFFPFEIGDTFVARKGFWTTGTTATGNLDMGIYSEGGTRLISSGAVAAVSGTVQVSDWADTTLSPGRYWLAFSCSTATFTLICKLPAYGGGLGCLIQDTAHVLPATATFAEVPAGTIAIPRMGITSSATF
jgi:hypothetical protein